MSAIQQGEFLFDKLYWEDKSNQAKQFIYRCLQRNPEDRPSAKECLEDFWIKRMSGADPEYHLNLLPSVERLADFRAETRLK